MTYKVMFRSEPSGRMIQSTNFPNNYKTKKAAQAAIDSLPEESRVVGRVVVRIPARRRKA